MRSRFAFFASLGLALPGPCTTFDDAAAPAAPDASVPVSDAGDADVAEDAARSCADAPAFVWAEDTDLQGCTALFDRYCCAQQEHCESDDACAAWVRCVNACALPRMSSCIDACGSPTDGGFASKLAEMASCRSLIDAAASCVYP